MLYSCLNIWGAWGNLTQEKKKVEYCLQRSQTFIDTLHAAADGFASRYQAPDPELLGVSGTSL